MALTYPLAAPSRGFYVLGVLLFVLYALAIAVIGLPFVALGTALPSRGPDP